MEENELELKLQRRAARAEEAAREEAALDARLAAALQELEQARAELAAVEIKLNILEGAANVLDLRLRNGSRPLPVSGDASR